MSHKFFFSFSVSSLIFTNYLDLINYNLASKLSNFLQYKGIYVIPILFFSNYSCNSLISWFFNSKFIWVDTFSILDYSKSVDYFLKSTCISFSYYYASKNFSYKFSILFLFSTLIYISSIEFYSFNFAISSSFYYFSSFKSLSNFLISFSIIIFCLYKLSISFLFS